MFSEKSSELQNRARRALISRAIVNFIVPEMDTRYAANASTTHDHVSAKAISVKDLHSDPDELHPRVQYIFIDEGQFLPGLAAFCIRQRKRGRRVIVAALSSTSEGTAWPEVSELGLAHADEIIRKHAICVVCQEPALYSRRLDGQRKGAIDLGADDKYTPVCSVHFDDDFELSVEHLRLRHNVIDATRAFFTQSH